MSGQDQSDFRPGALDVCGREGSVCVYHATGSSDECCHSIVNVEPEISKCIDAKIVKGRESVVGTMTRKEGFVAAEDQEQEIQNRATFALVGVINETLSLMAAKWQ